MWKALRFLWYPKGEGHSPSRSHSSSEPVLLCLARYFLHDAQPAVRHKLINVDSCRLAYFVACCPPAPCSNSLIDATPPPRFLLQDYFTEDKKGSGKDDVGSLQWTAVGVLVMLAITILVTILHGHLVPLVTTGLQYWFMNGTYVNILQVRGGSGHWGNGLHLGGRGGVGRIKRRAPAVRSQGSGRSPTYLSPGSCAVARL